MCCGPRAIPFEKVVEEGVLRSEKKPRGGLEMVPISLRGGLQKRQISLRRGITTGPLYYCGVINFVQPPKFHRGTLHFFLCKR